MTDSVTFLELLTTWCRGESIDPKVVFLGYTVTWWLRACKIVQYIGGCAILIEIVGEKRLAVWASSLRCRYQVQRERLNIAALRHLEYMTAESELDSLLPTRKTVAHYEYVSSERGSKGIYMGEKPNPDWNAKREAEKDALRPAARARLESLIPHRTLRASGHVGALLGSMLGAKAAWTAAVWLNTFDEPIYGLQFILGLGLISVFGFIGSGLFRQFAPILLLFLQRLGYGAVMLPNALLLSLLAKRKAVLWISFLTLTVGSVGDIILD